MHKISLFVSNVLVVLAFDNNTQGMQSIKASDCLLQKELIVCPGSTVKLENLACKNRLYHMAHPILIFGTANKIATFTSVNPVIICGNTSNKSRVPLLLSVESNVNVLFENTLTIKNMALELKTDAGCSDLKKWHRPNFTVAKRFSLVGVIGFKSAFINKIDIIPGKHTTNSAVFDVSNLNNTLVKFEKNWDSITIAGRSSIETAVINYYNTKDTPGISNISDIKNIDRVKKEMYIQNVRNRIKKLFVGKDALLRKLKFKNIEIFNYNFGESLFTDEIKDALKKLEISVINKVC